MKKLGCAPLGASWRWVCVLVLSVVLLGGSNVALAQTFTFTGDATEKTYGGPLCTSNSAINLKWTFSPQGAFTVGENVVFRVLVGAENEEDGAKITTLTVAPTASTEGTNLFGSAVGEISANVQDLFKSTSKGLFANPKYLTVRDLIGYARIADQSGPTPTADNICDLGAANDDQGSTITKICVLVKYSYVDNANGTPTNTSVDDSECVDVKFDLTPPQAATGVALAPSEKQITLSWNFLKDHEYDVYVSQQPFTADNQQDIVATPANGTIKVVSSPYTIKNLSEQTKYYVAIRTTDAAGNQGALSEVVSGSTVELTDFYEAYRNAGGADKGFSGGFCFIATAAYGTYDHSYVKILRDFRDQHLLTNGPGKAFVAWYYSNSPVWADWIRAHPKTKRVVQAMLLPLIAVAAFFVRLSLGVQIFLLMMLFLLVLGFRYRRRALLVVPAALLLVGCSFSSAEAASPRNFGLEIRAGIYQPQIDQEAGLTGAGPYKSIFGDPLQLYLETHIEWLVFKKYGSIGIGGSVGFTWAEGKTLTAAGTPTTTTEDGGSNTNSLWIIPLRLDVSYRMDYFAINHGFPLVPYVRAGLDYYVWFVTDPGGAIAKDSTAEENAALGGRFGFHVGLGMQFLLDILDRRSARTFDSDIGVNHTYLFFEWNFSWVGTFTPGLNLSDSSFRAGLLFQF